jgi:hypothetical protein
MMNTDPLSRLENIKPSMGRQAMCDAIVEVGKALEIALPAYGRMTLISLSQQILQLRTELLEAFPLMEDPAPYLALISALPLDMKAAHQLTYDFGKLGDDPGHGPVLFELTRALVDNLKRNNTLEREAEFFKHSHTPRAAGDIVWTTTDFERVFDDFAYLLLDSQAKDPHCCLDLVEHVFSFSINCRDLNLQGGLLTAMLALNTTFNHESACWPAVKQWLKTHEDRVCASLLSQGWSRQFKPELAQKALALGYPKLHNAIVLRSCRHNESNFLALKRFYGIDPDQTCYDIILKNHRDEACGADSTSLTALLAHALVYDHQLPEDWMIKASDSPLKLLDSAYQEVKKSGLLPSNDKLHDLFEESLRKLRNDRDLSWLESSIFAPFLRQSLAYQAERFGQDLGL